ncbi:PspA/IM30 family protein [Myxosarcina sp. GI1(2024)]
MRTVERIQRIIKANINSSLNNPEKSLDKHINIKEMETTINQFRKSIVQISAAKKTNAVKI